MNTAVFGEDLYTSVVIESLIGDGHRVSLLITTKYAYENHKVLEHTAKKYGIEIVNDENINSSKIKDCLKKIKPDIIIVAHLRKILSKEIFSMAAKGAINVHPSLLPKYRGLSPQHQAILHGDTESGVTVHYIDEDVDTGDIIVQKKFPVTKNDYIIDVQTKMLTIYKRIVVEALHLLKDVSFKPIKQEVKKASYFGPLKKTDRKIDLSRSKHEIHNLVKAVSLPYKGAFYDNYIIWATEMPVASREKELMSRYYTNGIYFDKVAGEIIIRLKDGFLVSDDFKIN